MFQYTTTIDKIRKLKKRIKAIQGGTSAGKTFGIIPILIDRAIKNPGLEISIVAESLPHLRKGAIKDFQKIMKETKRWDFRQWKETRQTYTFYNGSYIEFFGADDSSKLKGPRRDVLYINEANNIDFQSYRELTKRTKQEVFLDWNPTNEFWFHDEIQKDDNVDFIILTYLDNEAAPKSAVDDILMSKAKGFYDVELEPPELFDEKNIKDPYWANEYRVYGLGLPGQLQGTVFSNWEIGKFDDSLPFCYGLDFGFSPDPTTLIKVAVDSKAKKVYAKEMFYNHQLSTDDIELMIRDRITQGIKRGDEEEYKKAVRSMIVADSAEKREINELRRKKLNVIKSKKGRDSIRAGIKSLQGYKIIVDEPSPNLEKELRSYVWNDKTSGIPIDDYNHLIDPLRYAFDYLALRRRL